MSSRAWPILLLLAICCPVFAQTDGCEFFGDVAATHFEQQLRAAPTCKEAVHRLHSCAWGSSADASFAPIAVERCEKDFLAKLSSPGRENYMAEMQLCTYRQSRAGGTIAISQAALCQADVAERFAINSTLWSTPPQRASFLCDRAVTPLEHAICLNTALGHADIVLSRAYRDALASAGSDQGALRESERAWLSSLPQQCKLDQPAKRKLSIECLRSSFEARFSLLDGNTDEGSERLGGRASFDCENPSTAMEIAICADQRLGDADIELAAEIERAMKAAGNKGAQLIADSQKKWSAFVQQSCPLGVAGGVPTVFERSCIRVAFETRVEQIKACTRNRGSATTSCLNNFRVLTRDALQ